MKKPITVCLFALASCTKQAQPPCSPKAMAEAIADDRQENTTVHQDKWLDECEDYLMKKLDDEDGTGYK